MNKSDRTIERFFVITGTPRSGTTYLSAVLHYPPTLTTLSEAQRQWRQFYKQQGRADPLLYREYVTFADVQIRS